MRRGKGYASLYDGDAMFSFSEARLRVRLERGGKRGKTDSIAVDQGRHIGVCPTV